MRLRGRLADRGYHDFQRVRGQKGQKRVSYVWQVVAAPTEYRDLLGRLFRRTDLQFGEWPPGFRFRNIHTGEEVVF